MMLRDRELEGRGLIPPYGPTRGTLQALQLLRRTTPARIDSDFLRVSKIAPGNEYKVVGALRFLGLIDEEGRPTESSRMLKTKGATYTLALQDIVRNAYSGVFQGLRPNEITRDAIYNYFVTDGGLGAEMATKATRFLIRLCRLAEIEIEFHLQTCLGAINRMLTRLPVDASSGLDRIRPLRLPISRLATEIERGRALASNKPLEGGASHGLTDLALAMAQGNCWPA